MDWFEIVFVDAIDAALSVMMKPTVAPYTSLLTTLTVSKGCKGILVKFVIKRETKKSLRALT
jgi:hypothetical protein